MKAANGFSKRFLLPALAATVVVSLVAISVGFAQPGRGGRRGFGFGPMGPGMGTLRMLHELDLTDAQRQQVRDLMQKARENGVQKQLMDAHKALEDAVQSPTFDENNIRNLAEELGTAEANAAVERAQMYQQILQILTDEQRQQLSQMQAEAKQRMEERQQRFQQRLQERSSSKKSGASL